MEELRKVLSLGQSDDFASEVLDIGVDVGGNWSALKVIGPRHTSANLSVSDLDFISDLKLETRNVDDSTVNQNVAVIDHLSGLEYGSSVAESPNACCKPELKQSKEVETGVATHPLSFLKGVRKLLFEHVVIAANDLLGQQLLSILRLSAILQVRTVLTGRVCPLGGRALSPSPDVVADGAANICLSSSVGRH